MAHTVAFAIGNCQPGFLAHNVPFSFSRALVNAFSGGDKGIEQNLKRLWTEQGDKLCAQYGMDPKVMEYLGKVAEAAQSSAGKG